MIHRTCSTLALFLLAATAATAQQTLVVDQAGTGQFTDIPPAIAAAAPGDRVLVLAGRYSAFTVDKPITVTTNEAVNVPSIHVQGIGAGSTCVVAGFTLFWHPVRLSVQNCPGRVHLQSITMHGLNLFQPTLRIQSARSISLSEVSFEGSAEIFDSVVSLERCTFYGGTVDRWTSPGLAATRSRLLVTGGLFRGTGGSYTYAYGTPPATSGIQLLGNSEARLTGGAQLVGGISFPFPGPPSRAPAIGVLSSRAEADPSVILDPIPSDGSVIPTMIPAVSVASQSAGSALTPEIHAPPGALVGLLGSYPSAPLRFAPGDIWLDLPTAFPLFTGTIPATGVLQVTVPISGSAYPQGSTFTMQAAVVASGALLVSTPATSSMR